MDERLERNKQFVAEFYDVIINQKDFEKEIELSYLFTPRQTTKN